MTQAGFLTFVEPCSLHVTKAHAVTGICFWFGDAERAGTALLVPSVFVPRMTHSCSSKIYILLLTWICVVAAYSFLVLNHSAYFLI